MFLVADKKNKLIHIKTQTPVRIDLGGGTLDIWPLAHILQEKTELWKKQIITLNIAINLYAEAEIFLAQTANNFINYTFSDGYSTWTGKQVDDEADNFLLHRSIVRYYYDDLLKYNYNNIIIKTTAQAPRGSGLGGSSSLMIALLGGINKLLNYNGELKQICLQAQNIEAGILGNLAGNQDHFAAAFGGVQKVIHTVTGSKNEILNIDGNSLVEHLVLAWSGTQHFSAFNNWLILEKVLSGDRVIIKKLAQIAECTLELENELKPNYNLQNIGKYLRKEWEIRRSLVEGITTLKLTEMEKVVQKCGSLGEKVCGAGGGGVLVALAENAEHKTFLENEIKKVGGEILYAKYSSLGLRFMEN